MVSNLHLALIVDEFRRLSSCREENSGGKCLYGLNRKDQDQKDQNKKKKEGNFSSVYKVKTFNELKGALWSFCVSLLEDDRLLVYVKHRDEAAENVHKVASSGLPGKIRPFTKKIQQF